jgi:hypothetical protein
MDTTDIIKELSAERDRIDLVIKLLSGSGTASTKATPPAEGKATRKKRRVSAEARKKMSEAQRKRWAVTKGAVKLIPAKVANRPSGPSSGEIHFAVSPLRPMTFLRRARAPRDH